MNTIEVLHKGKGRVSTMYREPRDPRRRRGAGKYEIVAGEEDRFSRLPLKVVDSLLDGLAERPEHLVDALPLLEDLARDERVEVRQRLASLILTLSSQAPEGIEDIARILADDPVAEVHEAARETAGRLAWL